jgi:hypothetical protein
MFFFSRYLPLGRSNPETSDENGTPSVTSNRRERALSNEVEMTDFQAQRAADSPAVFRARMARIISRDEFAEGSFDDFDEGSPSPMAVVAVRICVWVVFLFGFLVLFHNQQERFMAERSRQNGKLRSTQLLHVPVPWVDTSAFMDSGTCFLSHFIDSTSGPFSIQRFLQNGKPSVLRRNNLLPMLSETMPADQRIHSIQRIGEESILLKKVSETEYNLAYGKDAYTLNVKGDVALFKYFPSTSTTLLVTRPRKSESTDCLTRYNGSTCLDSKPIPKGRGYFFDEIANVVVSVGTDSTTVDGAGNHLKGIFFQTILPNDGAVDLSFTVPFINRFDEGLWAFQNTPLTNGFIVLLPVIGFPPSPVQHLVALIDLAGDVKKGSVLRMESQDLRLFRKIDTVKYLWPQLDSSICNC